MDSTSSLQQVMNSKVIVEPLLDQSTRVTISIQNSWETIMDFAYLGRQYVFNVTRWRAAGKKSMLTLFHLAAVRDPKIFGTLTKNESTGDSSDDDSIEYSLVMTREQKVNAVIQMCRDIMKCLDMIVRQHQRAVVDYALWFREKYFKAILNRMKETSGASVFEVGPNYFETITELTCHMIVHVDFFNPNITYELVLFSYPQQQHTYSDVLRKRQK